MEDLELESKWVDEFAPKTIDDMILCDEQKKQFKGLINSKQRFDLLLVGPPGIGKSTLTGIIAKELNAVTLVVNCAQEGTVSVAQTKIANFCSSVSMDGRPKVVILDELDSASSTQENSFQKVLRNVMSSSPDTMFFGSCNYAKNVLEPIQSRLGVHNLTFAPKDIVEYIIKILTKKNIKFNKASVQKFIDIAIKVKKTDIRQIISDLQKCCYSGELIVNTKVIASDPGFIKTLIDTCKTTPNILDVRKFYITNKSKIEDYIQYAGLIFNYVLDHGLISDNDTILKMSNIIYQMNLTIDKEIQFFGLITVIHKVFSKNNQ